MLDHETMRRLSRAYDPYASVTEHDILGQIGNPSPTEIIDTALAGLASDDRNLRVLMLRVLKGQSGPRAMQGILAGLNDPKRRVREVAIKSSADFHSYPEITDRLKAMVADEHETRRIRNFALNSLAGAGSLLNDLTATDVRALESLAKIDAYRAEILFGLLKLDLTAPVEDLLHTFVANGAPHEAVMATRALCGFRVVNLGQFEPYSAVQKYIVDTCEVASGRVWYWVKREHYAALISGQLPPSSTEQ
jgi:hypothetical protein